MQILPFYSQFPFIGRSRSEPDPSLPVATRAVVKKITVLRVRQFGFRSGYTIINCVTLGKSFNESWFLNLQNGKIIPSTLHHV